MEYGDRTHLSGEDMLAAGRTGNWIWPETYSEPTESDWMFAHKFGYLNFLSGVPLEMALRGPRNPEPKPTSFSELVALAREGARRPCVEVEWPRACAKIAVSPYELIGDEPVEHVRYCRSCLHDWYHAEAFQFRELQSCPFHGEPLRDECWNCGRRWTEAFQATEYRLPLHCPYCCMPLAGVAPQFAQLFPHTHPAARAVADIQRRLEEARAGVEVEAVLPARELARNLYSSLMCAGVSWPACINVHRIALLPLHPRRIEPAYELEDFREAAREVRSVGRKLARLFPQCRSHRAAEWRVEHWQPSFQPRAVSLHVPTNGCVSCWAMALWRLQFMSVFAVLRSPNRFKAFFMRRRPLLNESLGFDLSNAASIAWASFGWCALAVADLARRLSNPETRELVGGGPGAEALEVWHRNPMNRCVFRREADGRMHACSLRPADAAVGLKSVQPWPMNDWHRYQMTPWGESLFETMYRPKDYMFQEYAWGWEDVP